MTDVDLEVALALITLKIILMLISYQRYRYFHIRMLDSATIDYQSPCIWYLDFFAFLVFPFSNFHFSNFCCVEPC